MPTDSDRSSRPEPLRLVRLTGRAAEEARASIAGPSKSKFLARKTQDVTADTFRIVVPPEQRAALDKGTQYFADPGKGAASLRLRDTMSGKPMPEARLERVDIAVSPKPSPAKVLGPVLWEAMAMATQQHFLVEINQKLAGLATGVDEVLAREDDRTLAVFREVHELVRDCRARLDAGSDLSSARVQEVHRLAGDSRREWHVLQRRASRLLDGYVSGTTESEKLRDAWELLWMATEVLAEISGLLTTLPHASLEDLLAAGREEHDRVVSAVSNVRELAVDMHTAHLQRHFDWAVWQAGGSRNPITNRVRAIRGRSVPVKPAQQSLGQPLVKHLRALTTPVSPPDEMLLCLNADGTVDVAIV